MNNIGYAYMAGRGVKRDVEGGLRLIQASAAARNPRAMRFLRTAGQARAAKPKGGSGASTQKAGTAKGKKAPAARGAQR